MRHRFFMLPVLFLLLPVAVALTAIVRELSLAELTVGADVIVLGTVVSAEARETPDGKSINTYSLVRVAEGYKGLAGDSSVHVETLGGRVGTTTVYFAGEARLAAGESVLLFLKRWPGRQGSFHPFGFSQGKFRVSVKAAGQDSLVERDLDGLTMVGSSAQLPPKTLGALMTSVRAILAGEEKKQ